jgi:hypothetical protein
MAQAQHAMRVQAPVWLAEDLVFTTTLNTVGSCAILAMVVDDEHAQPLRDVTCPHPRRRAWQVVAAWQCRLAWRSRH